MMSLTDSLNAAGLRHKNTTVGSICDLTEPQKYQHEKKSLPEGQGTFKTEKSRADITDSSQTGSQQYALQNKSSLDLPNDCDLNLQ